MENFNSRTGYVNLAPALSGKGSHWNNNELGVDPGKEELCLLNEL